VAEAPPKGHEPVPVPRAVSRDDAASEGEDLPGLVDEEVMPPLQSSCDGTTGLVLRMAC
jgi:hypothetical protein